MLNINEIISSSLDENTVKSLKELIDNPSENEFESISHIHNTLLAYSNLLLKNYHNSLKQELAKFDIEI